MSLTKRILVTWIIAVLGLLLTFVFPHEYPTVAGFISYSLQLLLLCLTVFLVKHETVKKTKFIFVNFASFFSVSILFHLYNFVGTVFFVDEPKARLFYFQYVSSGLYFFLLAFAICYLTLDVLFRDFRAYQKYLLTFTIVGGFFAYYYSPYLHRPEFLYSTTEIVEWREADRASAAFTKQFSSEPDVEQLATFLSQTDAPLLSAYNAKDRLLRVSQLHPYLAGSNYMILLLKPIYMNVIYMCVLCVGLILLFFGYQYKKDPPQGAYIEKIMFFFLIFCTLEIFHAWSFIKAIEWQSFSQFVTVGQYLSAFVLFFIAVFFGLRLRFITSVNGEFYEQELVESPNAVTRWRDALDNMVIKHFFNRKDLIGRFFVDPNLRH